MFRIEPPSVSPRVSRNLNTSSSTNFFPCWFKEIFDEAVDGFDFIFW